MDVARLEARGWVADRRYQTPTGKLKPANRHLPPCSSHPIVSTAPDEALADWRAPLTNARWLRLGRPVVGRWARLKRFSGTIRRKRPSYRSRAIETANGFRQRTKSRWKLRLHANGSRAESPTSRLHCNDHRSFLPDVYSAPWPLEAVVAGSCWFACLVEVRKTKSGRRRSRLGRTPDSSSYRPSTCQLWLEPAMVKHRPSLSSQAASSEPADGRR